MDKKLPDRSEAVARPSLAQFLHPLNNLKDRHHAVQQRRSLETSTLGRRHRDKQRQKLDYEIKFRNAVMILQAATFVAFTAVLGSVMHRRSQGTVAINEETRQTSLTALPEGRKDTNQSIDQFTAGPFHFVFAGNFPHDRRRRIASVLQLTAPRIERFIPVTSDLAQTITIKPSSNGTSFTDYKERELLVNSDPSDGVLAHEFVHLYHGNHDTFVNYLEEGTATAVSILATDGTQLESFGHIVHQDLSENMKNGGLAVLSEVQYIQYEPLLPLRLYIAAQLWIELEKKQPGCIRRIHEEYYRFLDHGGDKSALFGQTMLDFIMKECPGAESIMKANPMMRFPKNAPEIRQELYIRYVHYRNDDSRSIVFNLVDKRGIDGVERGRGGTTIQFTIENLDTGSASGSYEIETRSNGEAVFKVRESAQGIDQLNKIAGNGERYRIIAHAGTVQQELLFTYH